MIAVTCSTDWYFNKAIYCRAHPRYKKIIRKLNIEKWWILPHILDSVWYSKIPKICKICLYKWTKSNGDVSTARLEEKKKISMLLESGSNNAVSTQKQQILHSYFIFQILGIFIVILVDWSDDIIEKALIRWALYTRFLLG